VNISEVAQNCVYTKDGKVRKNDGEIVNLITQALKTLEKEHDCEMVLKDGELNGNAFKIQSLEEEISALRKANECLEKRNLSVYEQMKKSNDALRKELEEAKQELDQWRYLKDADEIESLRHSLSVAREFLNRIYQSCGEKPYEYYKLTARDYADIESFLASLSTLSKKEMK
jgi:type II secretory pathway component PulJ